MKAPNLRLSTLRGFTLIELLIVIGILGILASALVATINPFEQLNKANDTNIKNASVEFHNAVLKYYTTKNALPWDTTANGGNDACNTAAGEDPNALTLNNLSACINVLAAESMLSPSVSDFKDLNKIYATEPNPQSGKENETTICFQPASISQQNESGTKYASNGVDGTNCKSRGGSASCYWCTQ
mgnify:CR=1 FL=1